MKEKLAQISHLLISNINKYCSSAENSDDENSFGE